MTPPPLTPCNQNAISSPSQSSSSAGPAQRVSICHRMSQSINTLGGYGDGSTSHQASGSGYSPQTTSSALPPTPSDATNTANTMPDMNMHPDRWDPVSVSGTYILENAFASDIDGGVGVDVGNWMQGSGNLASAPGVAVPWKSVTKREPDLHEFLSSLKSILPSASAPANVKEESVGAATPSPLQGKRPRPPQENDEDEDSKSHMRKRSAAPNNRRPPPPRPHAIPWEVRELKDEDFEHSCEWCPFFIHEPFKFDSKPWNSCAKQRAESSHIVTHIVADHGILRGNNGKRPTQRYLTKCASHNNELKGKSDCSRCQKVQTWTEEELMDKTHAGKSVCLRCYEELPNKKALFDHLQERSICLYREDLPMKQKSRILYSAFCSNSSVPRFRPPPETSAPRDGARKRNMKCNRRPTAEVVVTQSSNPGIPQTPFISVPTQQSTQQSPRQPHQQRQQWTSPLPGPVSLPSSNSMSNPDYGGDRSGNYFPATTSRQPTQPQQLMQPTLYPQHARRMFVSRQPVPSYLGLDELEMSPQDFDVTYASFAAPMQLTQPELTSPMITASLAPQTLQHSTTMQLSGQHMGKLQMYPTNDSGYGSQNGGDQLQSSPVDDFTFSTNTAFFNLDSQYFNNGLNRDQDWG